jgi:uncharacterized protein YjbI with pentapeptide repeats
MSPHSQSDCSVWMFGHKCGRDLHSAPDGVDREPVCLMHSNDPGKQTETLSAPFWHEFESTLSNADDEADFTEFIFPDLPSRELPISIKCRFDRAIFRGGFFVFNTIYEKDVSFSGATFKEDADFRFATFKGNASFEKCKFEQSAIFSMATFEDRADFAETVFALDAFFTGTKFAGRCFFSHANFVQAANFREAVFEQEAFFVVAAFTLRAYFKGTEFHGESDWRDCRFLSSALFRNTQFNLELPDKPSADFSSVSFAKPEDVVFDDVDLSRVSLRDTDVTKIFFTSSVRWGKRRDGLGGVIFDEIYLLDASRLPDSTDNEAREYQKVGQTYQQLMKNYDARLDYWTADNFHFGEMEMQRLSLPEKGRLLRIRRWWHPRLSLVALYRWGSDYGNNYWKPMSWLGGFLLVFALLYPILGLQKGGYVDLPKIETYRSVWHARQSERQGIRWEIGLAAKSLLTSVDISTFQKNADYAPAYPWGRVLAIIQALLTSTLFALFLLAVRRQFRR